MTAADLIAEALAAGGKVTADGPDLVLTAPRPLPTELLGKLKAHKPDILTALAVDDQAADLREHFEERAAILEYDAGLPRPEAELQAARITATLARNRGYLWASLRAALTGYPVLLAQVLQKAGPVDALPFGVPKLAVLKNQRVVRQGAFSGVPEVKA